MVSFGIKSFGSKMARHDNPIPSTFQDRNDDDKDLEIAVLRRIVELLQNLLGRQHQREIRGKVEDHNPFEIDDDSSDEEAVYQRHGHQHHYHDGNVKVDIPEFDGMIQGDTFLDWLFTIERIFYFKNYSKERKVKLVAIKLKGYASLWWENLKRKRIREGRRPIRTWDKIKRELKRRFMHENYRQDNYMKFHNLKQFNLSVEDYTREFEYLSCIIFF